MTGESKFRGVIGDYDTGSKFSADQNFVTGHRTQVCSYLPNEKIHALPEWIGLGLFSRDPDQRRLQRAIERYVGPLY